MSLKYSPYYVENIDTAAMAILNMCLCCWCDNQEEAPYAVPCMLIYSFFGWFLIAHTNTTVVVFYFIKDDRQIDHGTVAMLNHSHGHRAQLQAAGPPRFIQVTNMFIEKWMGIVMVTCTHRCSKEIASTEKPNGGMEQRRSKETNTHTQTWWYE